MRTVFIHSTIMFLLCLPAWWAHSQEVVTMQLQQPLTADVNTWSVNFFTSGKEIPVSVSLYVTHSKTGTVLKVLTKEVVVQSSRSLSWIDLMKQYAAEASIHKNFKEAFGGSAYLVPGSYSICWTLYSNGKALGEGCQDFVVEKEQPMPMVLIAPANGDTIPTPYPIFTWTPVPTEKEAVYYNLFLYLVEKGQTPEGAVAKNQPYYQEEKIPDPMYTYPATANALKEQQYYAWQVIAQVGKQVVASNIEDFVYAFPDDDPDEEEQPEEGAMYFQLSAKPAGFYHLTQPDLHFIYVNENTQPTLKYTVQDEAGKTLTSGTFNAVYGFNFFSIDLSKAGLKQNAFYQLLVAKEKSATQQLAFQVSAQK